MSSGSASIAQLTEDFAKLLQESAPSARSSASSRALSQPAVLAALTPVYSYDRVRAALRYIQLDSAGHVEADDYVNLIQRLDSDPAAAAGAGAAGGAGKTALSTLVGGNVAAGTVQGKLLVQGSNANVSHTIDDEERREFTRHINSVLSGDADIGTRLPIPMDTMQIFDECRDGLILSKLINDAVPDTIDERVLNKSTSTRVTRPVAAGSPAPGPKPINAFQMTENNNLVITSAKALGLSTVNIGARDLVEGREHLILGLIWQIIRKGLLGRVDIKFHPELWRLLEDGEEMDQFLRLKPDLILLRWFNYHLKAAGWPRRVNNFSKDICDGENYIILLNQINPTLCSTAALKTADLPKRAEQILQSADALECRKYLTPASLLSGNAKLNLAFVAHLFNTHPSLEPLEEKELEAMGEIEDFDAEGEREARVFTLWLNSLDVEPGVGDLFEDLKDGIILLQAFDKVIPSSVNWKRVGVPKAGSEVPLSRFKAVENTNYAIDLAKDNKMFMVGIQGADLVDGSRTLTLGLVWQLMRRNISSTLALLSTQSGHTITDSDILKWANNTVQQGGKTSRIKSFADKSLASGEFFLDLLDCLRGGYVDYSIVERGGGESKSNAKLAISIARKLGSLIFIVAEDIVEVRPRLILTFTAALMVLGSSAPASH